MRPTTVTQQLLTDLVGRVASSGELRRWPLTEVFTGDLVVDLPQSTPADIEAAIAESRRMQAEWAARPLKDRLAVFERVHSLMIEHQETVTDLLQVECGKARRMAFEESCDPPMVVSHYLKRAPKVLTATRHAGPVPMLSRSTEVHEPRGVVAVIAPWNFPYAVGISDSIPALIAGNGVVMKPDNKTALSPLFGVKLLEDAGLPKGLLQVVCGEGPDVGPTLIDNVDYVMFTGSTATGRVIGQRAGENLIACCLELGGKNPMLVLDDAAVDEAIKGAMFSVWANTGQACMHIERIYVHDSLYEAFRDKFVRATQALSVGPAYDFSVELGGLSSPEHLTRVQSHVNDAIDRGAVVLTGGKARPDLGPTFFEPTILEGTTKDMLHGVAETFGPVVSLHRFTTDDEAVDLANDTEYGLNASIWTTDIKRGEALAARIEAGSVNINDGLATSFASKGTPSGGYKTSGVGARHGDQGLLKYTDVKNVAVLKKQVMAPRPGQTYDEYAKQTQTSLRWMRKLGIR